VRRQQALEHGLLATVLVLGCGPSVPRAASVLTGAPAADRHRYCTATFDQWHVPQCVGELTVEQARRRFLSFRLVEKRGRVVRVDRVSSGLRLSEDSPGVTATEFRYDGNRVVELLGLDRNDILRTRWRDSIGRPFSEDNSPVSGADETLDERGRVVELRYVDANGTPATRSDRVKTVRYRYGSIGLIVEESYFARDGLPQVNMKGVHRRTRTYDADGLEHETGFFGLPGQSAARSDGVQRIVQSFDDHGNPREEATFDSAGNLHEGETRASTRRDKRDELGRPTEYSFFDRSGAPATSSFGYVTRRVRWSEHDQVTEFSFFDGAGTPAPVPDGHSTQRVEFDSRDRLVRKAWFNADGTPHMKHGACVELYFYDGRDNPILRRSLTETGAPTKAEDGHYSILRQTFDVDRLVKKEYLDESGRLFAIDGVAGVAYVYDSLGTHTTVRLDARGLPVEPP
jgi:hypothetical protein